jgi:Apea-like HEPN
LAARLEEIMADIATEALPLFAASYRAPLLSHITGGFDDDPFMNHIARAQFVFVRGHRHFPEAVREFENDPELTRLASQAGELDPMYLHSDGGSRLSTADVLDRTVQMAYIESYCRQLLTSYHDFADSVVSNIGKVRQVAKAEAITICQVVGLVDANLPSGRRLPTPWGELVNAPADQSDPPAITYGNVIRTSLLLIEPQVETITVDRSAEPRHPADPDRLARRETMSTLLPLAFSLSQASNPRAVPLVNMFMTLTPFFCAMSYPLPSPAPRIGLTPLVDVDKIDAIGFWSETLHDKHSHQLDVAAHRIVSAIGQRWDASDKLIDAVTAWENICGTKEETTFRVTGALSKLIESDRAKRLQLRKELGRVYTVRSQVVHGVALKVPTIDKAARQAIDIALRSLAEIYSKRPELISMDSTRRADELLLVSD